MKLNKIIISCCFCMSFIQAAQIDMKNIKYGEKTEVDNGFIIFEDKKNSGDIYSLKQLPKKKIEKVEMPKAYKACISCHGKKGDKKPKVKIGKVSYLAGMNKLKLSKKLFLYRNGTYSLGNGEIMYPVAKKLKDKEIKDIALYLSQQEKIKETPKKKIIGPQLPNSEEINLDKID